MISEVPRDAPACSDVDLLCVCVESGRAYDEFWQQSQRIGTVPRGMQYEKAGHGRVKYEDLARKFTSFADKCIIKNRRWVSKIMNEFNLPRDARVLADDHYRCPAWVSKRNKRREARVGKSHQRG